MTEIEVNQEYLRKLLLSNANIKDSLDKMYLLGLIHTMDAIELTDDHLISLKNSLREQIHYVFEEQS